MERKLKMLFAFFRALGSRDVFTGIFFDQDTIEDWDRKYQYWPKNGDIVKFMEPPTSIGNIIEELVDQNYRIFERYNNYNYDTYWLLNVDIKPFDNKIIFTSECKAEFSQTLTPDIEFNMITEESRDFIKSFYVENENLSKIEISFYGRYDDSHLRSVLFDDRVNYLDLTDRDNFLDVVNEFMLKVEGRFWDSEGGCDGEITIVGDHVWIEYERIRHEYDDTELNLEINLDNAKEYD